MDSLIAKDCRKLLLVFALGIFLWVPEYGFAATRYAAPNGKSSNSGSQASSPWDADSCFNRLSPGDTCIYLSGNYGGKKFRPRSNGTKSSWITHRCEARHTCWFDQMNFDGNQYLRIINVASDSNFYDSSKSYTNPRMLVRASSNLVFDSIFVRGEPELCARGNPGPGCEGGSEFSRYNDLVRIGNNDSPLSVSHRIEITGASEFINGNHAVIQFFDDGDTQYCEANESDIWIHGTADTPIRMSSKYHHILALKGACRVLVEYVDFGPAGNGRGDLMQPDNGHIWQSGGIIHGSTINRLIVRHSNFTRGGSGSDKHGNQAHIEIGMFGRGVNGACFPHNSHYRPWGTFAIAGRLNEVPYVENVSILNNAVAEGWYMTAINREATTSRYEGFLLARASGEGKVSVDIDGLAFDSRSAPGGLLYGRNGARFGVGDVPLNSDGVSVGSTMISDLSRPFRDPANGDYRPFPDSRLVGAAVPIARTTASGSGSRIPVDRPECFAGTMSGMRKGDTVVIGGARCTIVATDLTDGTLSCSEALSWTAGEEVYYRNDEGVIRDIGSRSPTSLFRGTPIDGKRPKPPTLAID
jgi:hypothetical protein